MGAVISLTMMIVSAMITITIMVIKFGIRLTLMLFRLMTGMITAFTRR